MVKIVGVYKITSPSGKIYIGQSRDIKRRFNQYRWISNSKKQKRLWNSFVKYGTEKHSFQLIHELPNDIEQEILDCYETFYIETFSSLGIDMLNISPGGGIGKRKFKELPNEQIVSDFKNGVTIRALSIKYNSDCSTIRKRIIGGTTSEERELVKVERIKKMKPYCGFIKGMIPHNKGKAHLQGNKNPFYGKSHDASALKIMSDKKNKKVICITTGVIYESTIVAANLMGLTQSSVAKVARGFQKVHKGYEFKYII